MLWTKLLLVCAAALLVGCNPPHVAESRKRGADTNREVYQVKGTVKELKADGKTAVIDHDEIPGYMDRMIMDFEVKDKGELAGHEDEAVVDDSLRVMSPGNRRVFGGEEVHRSWE